MVGLEEFSNGISSGRRNGSYEGGLESALERLSSGEVALCKAKDHQCDYGHHHRCKHSLCSNWNEHVGKERHQSTTDIWNGYCHCTLQCSHRVWLVQSQFKSVNSINYVHKWYIVSVIEQYIWYVNYLLKHYHKASWSATYFIMKSSHAWGFLLRAFTTGPYSCASTPYCDNISATSAASVFHFNFKLIGSK